MENFFSRYKNPLVLMAILFVQVVVLATQVKRPEGSTASAASGGTRLIRLWTINTMSPFERGFVSTSRFFRRNFHNYIDLHDVRKQNRELQDEVAQLKLEQVRLRVDADQAKRLQTLLGFTQHYVGQVVPAQVIGTSGAEQVHTIQIDRGSRNGGIKVDMPVITPDGIVGKIKDVQTFTSTVLLISDRESGAGVILQSSRLQGILRGSPQGELHVGDIMSDEKIDAGEEIVTSGGDRVYPKGLPVGTVIRVAPDRENDPFLSIKVKPAADLNSLEEVLVVTKITGDVPQTVAGASNLRAADILSERLPSVPKPDETKKTGGPAPKAPVPPGTGASTPHVSVGNVKAPASTPAKPAVAAIKNGTEGSTQQTLQKSQPPVKKTSAGGPAGTGGQTVSGNASGVSSPQTGAATVPPKPKSPVPPAKQAAPKAIPNAPNPGSTAGNPVASQSKPADTERPPR